MITVYDLLSLCCYAYYEQLERIGLYIDTDNCTEKQFFTCNICAMAYDMILRGDY